MSRGRQSSGVEVGAVIASADRSFGDELVAAQSRRKAPRVATQHNAALEIGNVRYAVEVSNVSRTGAQICIRQGLMPSQGEIVTLRFMGRLTVTAKVVWIRNQQVGLRLADELADCLDAVFFDDLGAEYYSAILSLQGGTR